MSVIYDDSLKFDGLHSMMEYFSNYAQNDQISPEQYLQLYDDKNADILTRVNENGKLELRPANISYFIETDPVTGIFIFCSIQRF